MKHAIFFLTLTLSVSSFAASSKKEFDENLEKKCHQELKSMGCVKSDDTESVACANTNKAKLSPACKALMDAKASE